MGLISARRVAQNVGVSTGTITHHFPALGSRPEASLPYAALRRALGRVDIPLDEASDALIAAAERLAEVGPAAIAELAAALTQDMLLFSPDGESDPILESRMSAFIMAAAVAPHDPVAREAAREYYRPMRATYEGANAKLLAATRRRYVSELDGAAFAAITSALCDGFVWLRRFDREAFPTRLFAEAWIRLFTASTVPAESLEEAHYSDSLVPLPPGSGLDPQKRDAIAAAAARVYETRGWEGMTVVSVASAAGISRPTVAAHFGDRNGLAAAVWARHLPGLRAESERDTARPLHLAVWNHLHRLAEIARTHRDLTGSFLEGVFAYTIKRGQPRAEDPADPRNLVPLPLLLVEVISANSDKFRPGYADSSLAVRDSASMLTNFGLHLAMTRPGLPASEVANRITETSLAGMLKKRPRWE